jgi:hypothetical protein
MTKPANVIDLLPEAARKAAQAVDPDRVPIEITTKEHAVNDAVIAALAKVSNVYTRNHQLVEILWADDELGQGPVIRALTPSRTREIITTACQFFKRKDDAVKVAHPPDWAVSAVHGRGVWPSVRPIVGILEAPAMRPDGSIIQDAGYDEATGYVLIPGAEFPRVPEAPTQDDARRALASLREVFADFPYASEPDRFTVIACVLTVLARPAIRGAVPAFVIRATTPGSGKGLQADAIGTIAHGRAPAKMSFPTKEEEREKVLGAYALRGAGIICFDNLAGGFGGAALDRCLTAIDTVELRILGKSEIPELKWRAVIIPTGNQPEYFGDTPRRVLQSQLEPAEENPEERDEARFAHHPLLPWVLSQRARLVVDALTLLRAHALAGRPREGCRTWGSFEAWAEIIPPAIVWAGGADPMLTRPALDATADAGREAAGDLLRCWAALDRTSKGFTAAEFLRDLYPADRKTLDESELYTAARSAVETLCRCKGGKTPDATALGYALRKLRRRTIGGQRIDLDAHQGGIRRWVVVGTPSDGADRGDDRHTPRGNPNGSNGSKSSPSSASSIADADEGEERTATKAGTPERPAPWRLEA